MRHGHGAALRDLLFEQRNHRAVGAEHVPEPYRNKFCALAIHADRLNDHFTNAFGCAHDVGGIDGLIRGNLHKRFHAEFGGAARHVQRPENVVFYGLVRAGLHQGNMLVRRRVKDDLRAIAVEQIMHLSLVAHAADQNKQIKGGVFSLQLLFYIVGVVFVNVENNQPFGVMAGNLAAELASDRAAPARHEHGFIFDISHNLVEVDAYLLPSEEILYLHFAELGNGDLTVGELVNSGQNLDGKHTVLTAVDDLALRLFVDGGHGHEDFVRTVLFSQLRQLGGVSRNLYAADLFSELRRVVVRDTDGLI